MYRIRAIKLPSWTKFADEELEGKIKMTIPYDVIEEDGTQKVPLIWSDKDLKRIVELEKLTQLVTNKKVLEIGAGNGYLAYYLSHFTRRYDAYETFPPYVVIYTIYIQPEVVRQRLNLNYIVKFVTDDDIEKLEEYDIGIYSGLSDSEHILNMLSRKCKQVIHLYFDRKSNNSNDLELVVRWRIIKS